MPVSVTVRNAVEAAVVLQSNSAWNSESTSIIGLLTVCLANFRIWLRDIVKKFADVLRREATKAPSTPSDTLVY